MPSRRIGSAMLIFCSIQGTKIGNQIPFAWLAFYEGERAFLFESDKKLTKTVNVFL